MKFGQLIEHNIRNIFEADLFIFQKKLKVAPVVNLKLVFTD